MKLYLLEMRKDTYSIGTTDCYVLAENCGEAEQIVTESTGWIVGSLTVLTGAGYPSLFISREVLK